MPKFTTETALNILIDWLLDVRDLHHLQRLQHARTH